MSDTFSCPECSVKLRRSPSLRPGARVQCPKCSLQFAVPDLEREREPEDEPAPPPPRREAARRETPRRDYDEDTDRVSRRDDPDRDPPRSTRRGDVMPTRRREHYDDLPGRRERDRYEEDEDYADLPRRSVGDPGELSNRYTIEIGEWFSLAFKHWGAMLGPFIGFAVLFIFIYVPLIFVFPVIPFVLPHLAAGPYVVAIKMLRGEEWTFGDFFGGFKWYAQILGMTFLFGLIMFACFLPVILSYVVVAILASQGGRRGGPGPEILLLVIPGYLLTLVGVYFVNIRFYHALPLIIDRNFGAIESLKGSWKLTQGHFWMTFLVVLLIGLINGAGVSLCYIGVLFTIPLAVLIHAAGYMLIAGSRPPVAPGEYPRRSRRRDYDDED